MTKSLELAKKISKQLDVDNTELIEGMNLHKVFEGIYKLNAPLRVINTLICAIIYAFDNDSNWSDLKKTSHQDKENILKGLNADMKEPLYKTFIDFTNEDINDCIGDYLDLLPDWRFPQIIRSRDYHSKSLREKDPDFSLDGMDDDKRIKAKEAVGKYIREGMSHRKLADELLLQVEKDYVTLNHRTEQDFNVKFTEQELKYDRSLWRNWIKYEKPLLEQKRKEEQLRQS